LILALLVEAGAVLWFVSRDTVDSHAEGSWRARLFSLGFVWRALSSDAVTMLFGVGPGQSYALLQADARLVRSMPSDVAAVWSVAANYVAETGVVGAGALAFVTGTIASSVWSSTERVVGFGLLFVWCTGVALATSYPQQPSLWCCLAILIHWQRQYFGPREPRA
jgi:hypothetical protein